MDIKFHIPPKGQKGHLGLGFLGCVGRLAGGHRLADGPRSLQPSRDGSSGTARPPGLGMMSESEPGTSQSVQRLLYSFGSHAQGRGYSRDTEWGGLRPLVPVGPWEITTIFGGEKINIFPQINC